MKQPDTHGYDISPTTAMTTPIFGKRTLALLLGALLLAVVLLYRRPPPAATALDEAPGAPMERVDSPATAPPAPAPAIPALVLEGEGLRVVIDSGGSTRPLAFGTERARALTVLTAVLGPPAGSGTNAECGAGPLDYVNWGRGLTVLFQHGAMVGWSARPSGSPELTTMSGIGVGSTRAELADVYEVRVAESTLGWEFEAGGLHGLLDGAGDQATITTLWAGTVCAFR